MLVVDLPGADNADSVSKALIKEAGAEGKTIKLGAKETKGAGKQIVLLGRGQGKRCIAHASMHSFSFRRLRRNHVRIVFSGTEYRVGTLFDASEGKVIEVSINCGKAKELLNVDC